MGIHDWAQWLAKWFESCQQGETGVDGQGGGARGGAVLVVVREKLSAGGIKNLLPLANASVTPESR